MATSASSTGQVDYSPGDFRRAKAAIEDAAARQQDRGPPDRLRRVKQIGDTTVVYFWHYEDFFRIIGNTIIEDGRFKFELAFY